MLRGESKGEVMGTKILIVEDEPNMVAGLRDNFEYEGFQVITALDGVEGLERALKDSPDLIVLDVMMPRMSGLDVCKQLKAKRPSTYRECCPQVWLTMCPSVDTAARAPPPSCVTFAAQANHREDTTPTA